MSPPFLELLQQTLDLNGWGEQALEFMSDAAKERLRASSGDSVRGFKNIALAR